MELLVFSIINSFDLMREKIETQLMAELSRKNVDFMVHFCEDKPEAIDILFNLSFGDDPKLAMRAAWVLEKLCIKYDNLLQERLGELVKELNAIPTSSVRRLVSKMLMLHTIPEEYEGEVFDFSLSMLEDPKEPVAVKANCMTVVFKMLPKYPELKNEVFAVIEDQIPYHSVGFKSRFKVLKRKYKLID